MACRQNPSRRTFASGLPPFQLSRGRLRLLPLPSSCMSPLVLVHGKTPTDAASTWASGFYWKFYHIVTPTRWGPQKEVLVLWLPRLQNFLTYPKVKPRPRKKHAAFGFFLILLLCYFFIL